MIRLTHKRNNGIKSGYWSPHKKDELVARLAEYENTGLDPEEIRVAIGYDHGLSPLLTKIINTPIGELIESLREEKGISQYELADKITTLNQSQISKIENGRRKISVDDLVKILKALGVLDTPSGGNE